MRFSVIFTEEAREQFILLPKSIKELIKKAIEDRLEIAPRCYGKPLQYSYKGHRRIRVSDYRIIYRIEEEVVRVVIVGIYIRRDAYK